MNDAYLFEIYYINYLGKPEKTYIYADSYIQAYDVADSLQGLERLLSVTAQEPLHRKKV